MLYRIKLVIQCRF